MMWSQCMKRTKLMAEIIFPPLAVNQPTQQHTFCSTKEKSTEENLFCILETVAKCPLHI